MKYMLLDRRESLAESLVSDATTFGLLLLCIWTSQGSTWWTFFTALMFIGFLGVKGAEAVSRRQLKFKNLDELQACASQEETA